MEEEIGKIKHFFGKISVAVIELTGELNVGDKIHVKGPSTDFIQPVDSMQIDHKDVEKATPGQAVGMKTSDPAREGDVVFKVVD
ncbi:translation elongation factor-like protein [Thermoproteota archaeon]